ncbi:PadR family transcriptional regulator [Nocardioides sp. BGMRC 2183]|nr:PadR family transcriptional regulator [Nocardioides sp. BGMRC 2183]
MGRHDDEFCGGFGRRGYDENYGRRGRNAYERYDDTEPKRRQRGGWGAWTDGPWGEHPRPGGHRGPQGVPPGPPPWLAGLLGFGRPETGRGPRVRRGDVRSAILDVLRAAGEREESPNGYQVIQRIAERSAGAWRPSPGSVYPTIQQLEDEGLVELDEESGRRALRLTTAGARYCTEHTEELAAVWAPFERTPEVPGNAEQADIKAEIPQVMSAVWQIVTNGSDAQRRAAVEVLADARRRLYGILADGPDQETPED